MPLRLFVLKEDPLVRYRLSAAVSDSADMVIVGDGAWTDETLGHLPAAQPDVLIFELFEDGKVPKQIAALRGACPAAQTKLFAVSRGEGLSEALMAIDLKKFNQRSASWARMEHILTLCTRWKSWDH